MSESCQVRSWFLKIHGRWTGSRVLSSSWLKVAHKPGPFNLPLPVQDLRSGTRLDEQLLRKSPATTVPVRRDASGTRIATLNR